MRVLTVEPGPVRPRVRGFGVVEPARSWTATAHVAGRIAALSPDFRRGARIEQGRSLARLEDADHRIAQAKAAAERAGVEARLSELDLALDNARESLAIEEAALALSERELARQRDLVERGAARARFRAILLTTVTTIAGVTPLLLETSLQAQALAPMVVSIAFGLIASTLLLLIVAPALFAILPRRPAATETTPHAPPVA